MLAECVYNCEGLWDPGIELFASCSVVTQRCESSSSVRLSLVTQSGDGFQKLRTGINKNKERSHKIIRKLLPVTQLVEAQELHELLGIH